MRAKHTLSFGALFQRNQNNVKTDSNGRGSFSFSGLATSGFDAKGQPLAATGYDFADFLLGLPNSDSIRFGDTTTYFRATNYSFFGHAVVLVAQTEIDGEVRLHAPIVLPEERIISCAEIRGRIAEADRVRIRKAQEKVREVVAGRGQRLP